MRTPILSLFAVSIATAGLVMAGDRPDAKLSYVRKGQATICPDEPLMRQLVAARLGHDPFREQSDRAIAVTITRDAKGFRAVLELRDDTGKIVGTRTLTSTSADCNELASSIALALTIAIDPIGEAPSASVSASAPPPPAPTIAVAPPPSIAPPPPPPPPPRPLWPFAAIGGIAALGAAPDLTFGLTTTFGLHAEKYSVAIEGRVDAEAGKRGPLGGEVRSSILAGAIVPCLHHDVLMVCGIAAYGSLRGAGAGVSAARHDRTPWAALGARIGLEGTVFGPIAFRAHADALALLTRTKLRVEDADAWTTPPFALLLGLAVVAHFQ